MHPTRRRPSDPIVPAPFRGPSPVGRIFLFGAATGLALGALLLLNAGLAEAGNCGRAVPCRCGDHVVADAVLGADLDECPGFGLRVVSGSVDCAGHRITGADRPGATAGIWLDGAVGRTVRDCRIEGFEDGILVDGGRNAVLRGNALVANTHGIWVGSGASRTVIESNEVRDNDDEGIHLGSGTSGASVSKNWIHDNRRENLYLLHTERNSVSDNVLDQSKAAGILLKHSSENVFVDNRVLKRSVVVRGDSHDNVFRGTVLASGGFVFQAFEEEDSGWSHPHHQLVTGGEVDASTCFEFLGSYANEVRDVAVDGCRHYEELEYGDLAPHDNVVSLVDDSPADDGKGDGGGRGSGVGRGRIKFGRSGTAQDRLRLSYWFEAPGEIRPGSEDVAVALADADSLLLQAEIPSGELVEGAPSAFRCRDREVGRAGNLRDLQLRRVSDSIWRLDVRATADLAEADRDEFSVSLSIGDDELGATHTWTRVKSGWRLRN